MVKFLIIVGKLLLRHWGNTDGASEQTVWSNFSSMWKNCLNKFLITVGNYWLFFYYSGKRTFLIFSYVWKNCFVHFLITQKWCLGKLSSMCISCFSNFLSMFMLDNVLVKNKVDWMWNLILYNVTLYDLRGPITYLKIRCTQHHLLTKWGCFIYTYKRYYHTLKGLRKWSKLHEDNNFIISKGFIELLLTVSQIWQYGFPWKAH